MAAVAAAAAAAAAGPPDSQPKPATAAAEEEEDSPKKPVMKKVPITDSEKNLQRLREARVQQKKRLSELRAQTKKEKRNVAKLNRKASKLSLDELVQISMVKFRTLKTAGLLEEDAEDGATAGSSADPAPEEVLSIVGLWRRSRRPPKQQRHEAQRAAERCKHGQSCRDCMCSLTTAVQRTTSRATQAAEQH
jgi:hypothetical protein